MLEGANKVRISDDNLKFDKIVLSVTTPSGYQYAKREYKSIEVINSPVDHSLTVKRFILRINPEILILNELEIWPNWILLLKKYNIPIALINGRISEDAFGRYNFFLFILKPFFRKIDLYLVQDQIYKQRFMRFRIPAARIKVCGNIKADEAFSLSRQLPSEGDIFTYLKIKQKPEKIVTLASSHSNDEKILIQAMEKTGSNCSPLNLPMPPAMAPTHSVPLEEAQDPQELNRA